MKPGLTWLNANDRNIHMNVRDKGNRGEREWRDVLNNTFHTKYARTPLSGGMDLKGDVRRTYKCPKTIADEFHWEVKRVEKLNIHGAYRQAVNDCRPKHVPVVVLRRNNESYKIFLSADDFLNLLVELEALRKIDKPNKKTDFETWVEGKNERAKKQLYSRGNKKFHKK